ncbi:hypothetical protein ACEPPN_003130 [Leptodophora sp. 'Broadleaf-Isolate-01']
MSGKQLRVVIVGAGFGGLTAAIECRLRGMHVTLVENFPTSRNYGDIIDFCPNGGRVFEKWDNGKVARRLLEVCINDSDKMEYCRYDGYKYNEEPWLLKPEQYYSTFGGHRGAMHQIITDYAAEIGVEMQFGQKVATYVDNEQALGVFTAPGKFYGADVVVAADGPKSIARQQVLGLPESKVASGYAIFRAHYTLTDEHRANKILAPVCRESPNYTKMWTGKDVHMIVYTWNKGRDIGWVLTHKDEKDIGESWSEPGDKDETLAFLEKGGFEEVLKEIVRQTPTEKLVDFKLVWRDPITTWLSPTARSVVIGDAAHCHLPTSAQGGCQAVEDGITLAICLEKSKGDVPLALRVFERIRFNRSHITHMSSISVRDEYHNADWASSMIDDNPEGLNIPRPAWVVDFDAEKNAEEHYDQLAADVKSNRQGTIEELSLPAGGSFDISERDYYNSSKQIAVK